jgi:uncharacterized protein YqgV (UPF0045/DUF77 family)
MTYDFFVFPAELAEDLDQATAVYESVPHTGTPVAGSAVGELVVALEELDIEVRGTAAAAYVSTSWDDPMAHLRQVAEVAAAHGLSVLDVQLGALYDPRDALDVALETQGGPRLTFVTRAILREVMSHIVEGRYHWVTLSRGAGLFVQTYRDDDGSWALEHREAPDRHFAARLTAADLVEDVLWSWARDDGRWEAQVAFSPITV